MNPSVALLAVKPERPSVMVLMVMGQDVKCILLCALSVVRNVKYPSSLERTGQCIVVSATEKED